VNDRDTAPDRSTLPLELGISVPERYSGSLARYTSRGGMVRLPEGVQGFLADENNAGDMARFYGFSLIFDQILKEVLKETLRNWGFIRVTPPVCLLSWHAGLGGSYTFSIRSAGLMKQT
jgi:hypothetical protein